jgi:hypothetical protein
VVLIWSELRSYHISTHNPTYSRLRGPRTQLYSSTGTFFSNPSCKACHMIQFVTISMMLIASWTPTKRTTSEQPGNTLNGIRGEKAWLAPIGPSRRYTMHSVDVLSHFKSTLPTPPHSTFQIAHIHHDSTTDQEAWIQQQRDEQSRYRWYSAAHLAFKILIKRLPMRKQATESSPET